MTLEEQGKLLGRLRHNIWRLRRTGKYGLYPSPTEKISQREMAELLGVPLSSYSVWERGVQFIPKRHQPAIERLMRKYGMGWEIPTNSEGVSMWPSMGEYREQRELAAIVEHDAKDGYRSPHLPPEEFWEIAGKHRAEIKRYQLAWLKNRACSETGGLYGEFLRLVEAGNSFDSAFFLLADSFGGVEILRLMLILDCVEVQAVYQIKRVAASRSDAAAKRGKKRKEGE